MSKFLIVVYIYCSFICYNFLCAENLDLPLKRNLKVLILIIASDDHPVYKQEIMIWRSYMKSMPKNVSAFFIKADPNLEKKYKIQGDTIYTKTGESIIPGIFCKTVLSLCALKDEGLAEFDFVLRTNLSSFYILHRLVKFCEQIPREKCFIGHVNSIYN